jgi:enoyl-CoA hydratase/carnithine racemase
MNQAANVYTVIRTSQADGVGHIELYRPERLNALSKEMLLEIGQAMDGFER